MLTPPFGEDFPFIIFAKKGLNIYLLDDRITCVEKALCFENSLLYTHAPLSSKLNGFVEENSKKYTQYINRESVMLACSISSREESPHILVGS